MKNDSFYRNYSRYSVQFVSIDYFFCEKCLFEKENKKDITLNDGELSYKMPDWAKSITKKVIGYDN